MIKGKVLTRSLIGAVLLAMMASFAIPALASTPPQYPHDAPSFWIEPPSLSFGKTAQSTEFNVTVYINVTGMNIFNYQVNMTYDPTQLNLTNEGYTHGAESDFYYPKTAVSVTPSFGPSSVIMGEALLAPSTATGYGSTIWAEFNITAKPPGTGSLTSEINITNPDTWVEEPNYTLPPIARFNASFVYLPEFPQPIMLLIAVIAASAASVVLTKKLKLKR
jgi:hypothetical protein